jgi:hypothetical protein
MSERTGTGHAQDISRGNSQYLQSRRVRAAEQLHSSHAADGELARSNEDATKRELCLLVGEADRSGCAAASLVMQSVSLSIHSAIK